MYLKKEKKAYITNLRSWFKSIRKIIGIKREKFGLMRFRTVSVCPIWKRGESEKANNDEYFCERLKFYFLKMKNWILKDINRLNHK